MTDATALDDFTKILVTTDQRLFSAMKQAVPSKEVQSLAESFVKVFEHEGRTLSLIEHLIVTEIDATVSAGTLFRTNSLASKVMTTWSRLNEGLEYLVTTISGPITTICSNKYGSLEINPEHASGSEDMQTNIRQLISIVQEVLDLITGSLDRCPLSFRIVCSYLKNHCMRKFPEQSLMAVGGFVILRFFSAALVTPEANGLLEEPPSLDARRILVLVSKTIQNLANRAFFREDFMAPLNTFLESNQETMNRFLDDISQVPRAAEGTTPAPNQVPPEERESALALLGDMLLRNIRMIEMSFTEPDVAVKKAFLDELKGVLMRLPKPPAEPQTGMSAPVEDPKKQKEEKKRKEKEQKTLEKKQKELEKQLKTKKEAPAATMRKMISLRRSDVRVQLESLYAEQLTAAAAAGNLQAVEELLLRDKKMVNVMDRDCQTALVHAASCGHVNVVRALLKAKADCYLQDKRGWTCLHCAAFHNHEEVLMELAKQRHIDFTSTNDDDNTPLHYFARNPISKNTETFLQIFLKGGVDINAQNCNMETPLHMAVWKNNPAMAKLLLDYGADPKIENFKRETPYDWVQRLSNPEFVAIFDRAIKTRSAQVASSSATGRVGVAGRSTSNSGSISVDPMVRAKTFVEAVRDNNGDVVRELLRQDKRLADAAFGQQKNTALHIAATHGHIAVARLLIHSMSKIVKNTTGWTPLMCALWQNHPDLAMMLLLCRHPVDVATRLEDGNTALHFAAKSDSQLTQSIIWGLCEKGADINAINNNGDTPLHCAVREGHAETVRQLLENGANRQKANKEHETPMDMAQRAGQTAILNLLLDRPSDAPPAYTETVTPPMQSGASDQAQPVQSSPLMDQMQAPDSKLDSVH